MHKFNCNDVWRLCDLLDTILEFLQADDNDLSIELSNKGVDLAYLSDIFEKLNEVILKLQGMIASEPCRREIVVKGFINKLTFLKQNMGLLELCHFF